MGVARAPDVQRGHIERLGGRVVAEANGRRVSKAADEDRAAWTPRPWLHAELRAQDRAHHRALAESQDAVVVAVAPALAELVQRDVQPDRGEALAREQLERVRQRAVPVLRSVGPPAALGRARADDERRVRAVQHERQRLEALLQVLGALRSEQRRVLAPAVQRQQLHARSSCCESRASSQREAARPLSGADSRACQ